MRNVASLLLPFVYLPLIQNSDLRCIRYYYYDEAYMQYYYQHPTTNYYCPDTCQELESKQYTAHMMIKSFTRT